MNTFGALGSIDPMSYGMQDYANNAPQAMPPPSNDGLSPLQKQYLLAALKGMGQQSSSPNSFAGGLSSAIQPALMQLFSQGLGG